MCAAVNDIHHRHWKDVGVDSADIAIQGDLEFSGRGARASHRDCKNSVCTELALIRSAIEFNHGAIDESLVTRIHAAQSRGNCGFNVLDCLEHSFPKIVLRIVVAQFHRFVFPSGSSTGNCRSPHGSAGQKYIAFHGRIAPRIQNLARANLLNMTHLAPHYDCL